MTARSKSPAPRLGFFFGAGTKRRVDGIDVEGKVRSDRRRPRGAFPRLISAVPTRHFVFQKPTSSSVRKNHCAMDGLAVPF